MFPSYQNTHYQTVVEQKNTIGNGRVKVMSGMGAARSGAGPGVPVPKGTPHRPSDKCGTKRNCRRGLRSFHLHAITKPVSEAPPESDAFEYFIGYLPGWVIVE